MAMNKRKTTTAIVAGVAAAALVLGGTFAWTSISQQAKNVTVRDINPGGRLHDDFNGMNKDIYVENFADNETGVPIFARIRLDEYMEIGPDAGEKRDDPARKAVALDNDADDGNTPVITDVTTWETYLPGASVEHNKDDNDTVYTEYWDWTLGRTDDLPYYMPTFNKNKDSLMADINGTYDGFVPGDIVHYDDYVEYAAGDLKGGTEIHDWDSDTKDEDEASEYDNGGITYSDATEIDKADVYHKVIADTDTDAHAATQITYSANVISMAEWLTYAEEDRIGPFWVYDEDGWAYWAQPIEPGETTGLLLDSINMSKTPDDNWYYGINAVGQFTTAADWETFLLPADQGGAGADSMTDNGKLLMHTITTPLSINAVLTQNGTNAADGSATYTLSLLNTRDELVAGETYVKPVAAGAATLAEGDDVAAQADGETIIAVYNDATIGQKNYSQDSPAPWSEYAAQITKVSIDNKIDPSSTAWWFTNMTALTTVDGLYNIDGTNLTSVSHMFAYCSALTDLDVTGFDVSNATSLRAMFSGCTELKTLNVSGWNTTNITDMAYVFYKCSNLETIIGIGNWQTGNVTTMDSTFRASAIKTLDLSKWDVKNVTSMNYMFYECSSLQTIDGIGNWQTSALELMQGVFHKSSALKTLDFSNWDVSNVTDMSYLFYECSNLETITGIENWQTGNVTHMNHMFFGCSKLTSLDLSNWETNSLTNTSYMFYNCGKLTTVGDISGWNMSNVTSTYSMFNNCAALTDSSFTNIKNWNVGKVTNMTQMFKACKALTELDLSGWDTKNVTEMAQMFADCTNLKKIGDLTGWDMGNVTTINSMFVSCAALEELQISGWNVSNVKDMLHLFAFCTTIEEIDVSGWQTDSIETMTGIFYNCTVLKTVKGLSDWDISTAKYMVGGFHYCYALEDFGDISNWNTANVTNMQRLFLGCALIEEVDISGWDTSEVQYMDDMFNGCAKLTKLTLGTGWDTAKVENMNQQFMNCSVLTLNCSNWNVPLVTSYSNFNTNATGVQAPTWVN